MSLRKDYDEDSSSFIDYPHEENPETLFHKKRVRKMLEEKLERKRLKQEIEEWDDEHYWDDLDQ